MNSINAVLATEAALAADRSQPRLVNAAHEFEAQMMKELLQPLTAKDALLSDEGDEGVGVLEEFAAESLALGVSKQGGLGVAKMIVERLSHSGNGQSGGEVISSQYRNNGFKSSND